MLFAQGDPGDLVYLVDEGEIRLVRHRVDGTDEHVANVPPGRYFGELAPLYGLRRSATAIAEGHTVVTGYTVADFRSLERDAVEIDGPPPP